MNLPIWVTVGTDVVGCGIGGRARGVGIEKGEEGRTTFGFFFFLPLFGGLVNAEGFGFFLGFFGFGSETIFW